MSIQTTIPVGSPESYINRELSWLGFARRVLALAQDPTLPLLVLAGLAGLGLRRRMSA